MKIKKKLISICLIPAKKNQIMLDNIIKSLADQYGAYPFVSHITLYAGMFMEECQAKELTNKALVGLSIKPFTVKNNGPHYSDIFTKTIYVDFVKNTPLEKIYQWLRKFFLKFKDFPLHPHLSLIYKNDMPVEEKIRVIKKLKIPSEILFDRIKVITASKSITEEKDVLEWKTIHSELFDK